MPDRSLAKAAAMNVEGSVESVNQSTTVFIALGANLQQPGRQLQQAIETIDSHAQMTLLSTSSFYQSEPMGPAGQPEYVNAVCSVETKLSPLSLLDEMQSIENQQGRLRNTERWGPRTLDLDLLLYGQQTMTVPRLRVPHPGITQRSFVLLPLLEIAPDIIIPGKGKADDYTASVQMHGIVKLESGFEA